MISCILLAALALAQPGSSNVDATEEGLNPIVSLFCNTTSLMPGDSLPIETMRTLRKDYGLRRFMFDPPGLRRPLGNADHAMYKQIGLSFASAREQLAKDAAFADIQLCWFARPVLCWSRKLPGQHIMDCEGHVSSGLCPLDDKANAPYFGGLTTVAKLGKPTIFIIEDDLNLSGHPGLSNPHGGCFCPLHMAEFAKRTGRSLGAAELGGMFDNPTVGNEPFRRAFAGVARDSLVRFSKQVRKSLDEGTKGLRTCLCQSAQVDKDGDTTEPDARALAGDTRPMVRVYGAAYFSQNVPADLPMTLAHTQYSMQHLPSDIEKLYEADSFPHTRFYNSVRFYGSEIDAAFMYGADDLLMLCVPTFDEPLKDRAYLQHVFDNQRRYLAVRKFRRRSSLTGVRAVYDPEEKYLYRRPGASLLDESARVLAKFGLPMTTLPSGASVLIGETAEYLAESKLREIFKGAVIVDSTAAQALAKRGLGAWLGCSVEAAEDTLEFARSRALPVRGARVTGLNSYDYHILEPVTPVPGWDMKMDYVRIAPGPTTETWIHYEDVEGRVVAPSFVSSASSLGGRVGVISFAVKGNFREWLYSPMMQDAFRNFFARYAPGVLDVVATYVPGTWVSSAVSSDGKELLVMANNLAGEPRNDIRLEFAEKWHGGRVERLQTDGSWVNVGKANAAFAPENGLTYEPMVAEFFRVIR